MKIAIKIKIFRSGKKKLEGMGRYGGNGWNATRDDKTVMFAISMESNTLDPADERAGHRSFLPPESDLHFPSAQSTNLSHGQSTFLIEIYTIFASYKLP
jgi:hypothetical protein